jgi:hypothetical protein
MVKLLFAHICDSAFISELSKNLNIIGIFENIGAKNFPAIHPKFSVVTCIQGDIGHYTQLLTIINKQSGLEISRVEGQSDIRVLDGKAIFIGTFIMINFSSSGEYSVNIFVDNNKIGNVNFNVGQ